MELGQIYKYIADKENSSRRSQKLLFNAYIDPKESSVCKMKQRL